MRRLGVVLVLAVVACRQEPSFDERYEQADREIREKAAAIDAELEDAGASAAATQAAPPASSPKPGSDAPGAD